MRTVIFACIHNAGRSQMAAAWLEALAGDRPVRAVSAGTDPAERVHPEVVEVMREVGIDLAGHKPQRLTAALLEHATDLVTMGCGEQCLPLSAAVVVQDWPLPDPKGRSLADVRSIRDRIRAQVAAWCADQGWAAS